MEEELARCQCEPHLEKENEAATYQGCSIPGHQWNSQDTPPVPDPWDLTGVTEVNSPMTVGSRLYKHCPGHMLASTCLTEEGVEGVVSSPPNRLITWHLAIGLDAMFQAVELPAGIADLDTQPWPTWMEMHSRWEGRQEVSECDTSDGTSRNDSHGNDC